LYMIVNISLDLLAIAEWHARVPVRADTVRRASLPDLYPPIHATQ
jgi:hypothetical protein